MQSSLKTYIQWYTWYDQELEAVASTRTFCFEAKVVPTQFYLLHTPAAWFGVTEKLWSIGWAVSRSAWSISWYGIPRANITHFGAQKAVTIEQKFSSSLCLSKEIHRLAFVTW